MATLRTMESSVLSFIVLFIIYAHAYNRSERVFMQYKLFIALVQTNMVLIIVDILGWIFNGLPGSINMACNKGFNLLLYILEPTGPMLSILYTNFQVFHDEYNIKKHKNILLILLFLNAVVSVSSLQTGWFFSVDGDNIYHRGEFFWIHALFCYGLLSYSFFFIIKKRRTLENRYYYSLLLYFLPQAVGSTIQMFDYGVSFNWSGMMLSLLIIYFNIQDRGLNTDYLTGLYNRRQLDSYIQAKIQNSTSQKSFSAIMIDLNEFKWINDQFGHKVGDEALQNAARVIKKCLGVNDFVARYGGDEFLVILEADDYYLLEQAVRKIQESVEQFNSYSQKPYKLKLSMGYAIYDYHSGLKADTFFKHIDSLMYNNKKIHY